MCKIAVFPHIPEGMESEVFKLARALTAPMTERDADGFGYMALGDHGVFGQRWLNPDEAWSKAAVRPEALKAYAEALEGSVADANRFGTASERVFSLSLHARMSTCGYGLENVHPFVNESENVALIHNGVISNSRDYKLRLSTCDSEAILHELENNDVRNDFMGLHGVVARLQGWYAVSALTRDNAGRWRLNLFKETRSNLYAAVINELDLPVFITDPEHLLIACEQLGFTVSGIARVRDNVALAINPLTGEVLETMDLAPMPEARFNAPELDYRHYREQDIRDYAEDLADDDGPLDALDYMDPFHVRVKRGA